MGLQDPGGIGPGDHRRGGAAEGFRRTPILSAPRQLQQLPRRPRRQPHGARAGARAPPLGVAPKAHAGQYRVIVFGVPFQVNTDIMMGHFSHYGEVVDIFSPKNKPTIAYVSFATKMGLQACLSDNRLYVGGHYVKEILLADKPSNPKGGGGSKGGSKGGRRDRDRDRDRGRRERSRSPRGRRSSYDDDYGRGARSDRFSPSRPY